MFEYKFIKCRFTDILQYVFLILFFYYFYLEKVYCLGILI